MIIDIQSIMLHWGCVIKYIPLIVGILFIGIGVFTFTASTATYLTLALLFSISFMISGISETVFAIVNRKVTYNWGWSLVLGLMTFLIGIVLLSNPQITLPLIIGITLLFRSISAIVFSVELKDMGVANWGYIVTLGILGIIFSLLLVMNPLFAKITIVLLTGISLIFAGAAAISVSFGLKKVHKAGEEIKQSLSDYLDPEAKD